MDRNSKLKNIEEANRRLLGESKKLLKENISFETNVNEDEVEDDDGGMAKIIGLYDENSGLQVQLTSWDESDEPNHTTLEQFIGHKIRVTIEIID